MKGFLLDTNIISELRKGARGNPGVREWFETVKEDELYISVLVVGEIRKGIERIRKRDAASARSLEKWLKEILADFSDRMLAVDHEVCDQWGKLGVEQPISPTDGLIAATAMVHGLVLVTRNEGDLKRSGARLLNPFSE